MQWRRCKNRKKRLRSWWDLRKKCIQSSVHQCKTSNISIFIQIYTRRMVTVVITLKITTLNWIKSSGLEQISKYSMHKLWHWLCQKEIIEMLHSQLLICQPHKSSQSQISNLVRQKLKNTISAWRSKWNCCYKCLQAPVTLFFLSTSWPWGRDKGLPMWHVRFLSIYDYDTNRHARVICN